MLILAMLVLGLSAGWAAHLLVGRGAPNRSRLLLAGLLGSFVGGTLASLISGDGLEIRASGLIGSTGRWPRPARLPCRGEARSQPLRPADPRRRGPRDRLGQRTLEIWVGERWRSRIVEEGPRDEALRGPSCDWLAVAVDLNPRRSCPLTRFRGVLLRPLGHATAEQGTRGGVRQKKSRRTWEHSASRPRR